MTTKKDIADMFANQILASRTVAAVPTVGNAFAWDRLAKQLADRIRDCAEHGAKLLQKKTGEAVSVQKLAVAIAAAISEASATQVEVDKQALGIIRATAS